MDKNATSLFKLTRRGTLPELIGWKRTEACNHKVASRLRMLRHAPSHDSAQDLSDYQWSERQWHVDFHMSARDMFFSLPVFRIQEQKEIESLTFC
jgi:hypothetical protein